MAASPWKFAPSSRRFLWDQHHLAPLAWWELSSSECLQRKWAPNHWWEREFMRIHFLESSYVRLFDISGFKILKLHLEPYHPLTLTSASPCHSLGQVALCQIQRNHQRLWKVGPVASCIAAARGCGPSGAGCEWDLREDPGRSWKYLKDLKGLNI